MQVTTSRRESVRGEANSLDADFRITVSEPEVVSPLSVCPGVGCIDGEMNKYKPADA